MAELPDMLEGEKPIKPNNGRVEKFAAPWQHVGFAHTLSYLEKVRPRVAFFYEIFHALCSNMWWSRLFYTLSLTITQTVIKMSHVQANSSCTLHRMFAMDSMFEYISNNFQKTTTTTSIWPYFFPSHYWTALWQHAFITKLFNKFDSVWKALIVRDLFLKNFQPYDLFWDL